ncbi:unnamed protein product [Dicrocoelium dendriticum]|nr:unnamed protein product [Dicrocoelium dendriticum]
MSSLWPKVFERTGRKLPKPFTVVPGAIKSALVVFQQRLRGADFGYFYSLYDRATGLEHVRRAHEEVAQAEKCFVEKQVERRTYQTQCFCLEEARTRLNTRLDGVSRSDEKFLELVTELHELSRQHKAAKDKLSVTELEEQTAFEHFSRCLRLSQAEERIHASRMKQWSIGFSVLAGVIGFGATWIRFSMVHPTPPSSSKLLSAHGQISAHAGDWSTHLPESTSQGLNSAIGELRTVSDQLHQGLNSAIGELRIVSDQLHQTRSSVLSEHPREGTSIWFLIACGSVCAFICSRIFSSR